MIFTQPNKNEEIDTLRIIASLFWIAGAVLTLYVAILVYKQNQKVD
ncbi:MAG: hypothetical protein Q8878_04895 [Bacillota bacterium]|nr:hypothetical protein [Bacillota bacterium]